MRKWTFIAVFVLMLALSAVPAATQDLPLGEAVTLEGIADIVSANTFELLGPTAMDPGGSSVVVFPDTADGFAIDVNNGLRLQVTGEVMMFNLEELGRLLPYNLNTIALGAYNAGDYAIIAASVTDTTDTVLMDDPFLTDIQTDPSLSIGELVTITGVADIVSPNVFRLLGTSPINLAPSNILVLPDTANGFLIDINNGMNVQVTGTLQPFDVASLEALGGYDLDERSLTAFGPGDFAIVATSVVDLTETVFFDEPGIGSIEQDPTVFVGRTITVDGVANILSSRAFEILETLPFDISPSRIVVLPDTATGYAIDINNGLPVTVTGQLMSFNMTELQAMLPYDLNETALAGYGSGDYALIARSVITD